MRDFFAHWGRGHYLYKVMVHLVDDDGEFIERWYTPHDRRVYNTANEYADSLDDLMLTMQEMARGYLVDSLQNYRLQVVELEFNL